MVRLIVSDWQKATPSEPALQELAAVRGIGVRFMVIPEWSGGRIPYARTVHCKFVVADGTRLWLGSSNGERSYFHASRNTGMAVRSPRMGRLVRAFFLRSWESSYAEPVVPGRRSAPREHGGE
ncbi:MAG: phospholipase D-like domain-containing protein [Bacteroidota bacterium]